MDRRQRILNETRDLVSHLLYDDRKGDEDLPRGEIQAAIAAGEITVDDILETFEDQLRQLLD